MIKFLKQILMGSIYLQGGIALILVGMAVLCIEPVCREFLQHFAIHIAVFGIWWAWRMFV